MARPTRLLDVLKPWRVFRSASSGRRVTRLWALLHPMTTLSDRKDRT